jgi:WD40 repeat protein
MEPCSVFKKSIRRELGLLTREVCRTMVYSCTCPKRRCCAHCESLSNLKAFCRDVHFTSEFGKKLCFEYVLEGHTGCVNRLAWNELGTKLASGSDDRKVRAKVYGYKKVI